MPIVRLVPPHLRPAACPRTGAERIDIIAEMMRTLAWRRGQSDKELARAWGLAIRTIQDYSAQASKRVASEIPDRDYVTHKISATLEELVDGAREELAVGVDNPNDTRRTIIQAARQWAEILGAMAPARVQVEVAVTQLTEDELRTQTVEAVRVLGKADPKLLVALAESVDEETPTDGGAE